MTSRNGRLTKIDYDINFLINKVDIIVDDDWRTATSVAARRRKPGPGRTVVGKIETPTNRFRSIPSCASARTDSSTSHYIISIRLLKDLDNKRIHFYLKSFLIKESAFRQITIPASIRLLSAQTGLAWQFGIFSIDRRAEPIKEIYSGKKKVRRQDFVSRIKRRSGPVVRLIRVWRFGVGPSQPTFSSHPDAQVSPLINRNRRRECRSRKTGQAPVRCRSFSW